MELQLGFAGLVSRVDVCQAGDARGLRLELLKDRDDLVQRAIALDADLQRPTGDAGAALATEANLPEGDLGQEAKLRAQPILGRLGRVAFAQLDRELSVLGV